MRADPMTQTNARLRVASYAALLLVVFYAVYSWALAPHVAYVQAVQRYEPVSVAVLREAAALRSTVEEDEEILQELRMQLADVGPVLFTQTEIQELFGDLASLAEQRSCQLIKVTMERDAVTTAPAEGKDATIPIEAIAIEVSYAGQAGDLTEVVGDLQAYDHKLFIRSVRLDTVGSNPSVLRCHIDMKLYVAQENIMTP